MERVHQLQAKLEAAFDAVLQKLFCQALNRLESNKSHTGGKAAAAAKSSPDDADARIEASEFFLSLDGGDENYEGTLDMADINRMFDSFDLGLSQRQRDRFFAFCDVDGDSRINAMEFQAG